MYINATQAISPQDTFLKDKVPAELIEHNGIMHTILPDFKAYFKPIDLRRMSRIIKSGTTTAIECLKEAGIEKPDAIITGTGLGCLKDTETFLNKMIDNNEGMLTPTTFIQSTHNTIGGHIALTLKCNEYNVAYVHKTISFETALLDAMLLIKEGEAKNILVGGIDEMTEENYNLKKKINLWKNEPFSNLKMLADKTNGCIPGEGSTFFVVSDKKNANTYAEIRMIELIHKFEGPEFLKRRLNDCMTSAGFDFEDVDLVIYGYNGDVAGDKYYDELKNEIFPECGQAYYKHFCGEYDTAPAFALWLAAKILKTGSAPGNIFIKKPSGDIKKILIYNQDMNKNHAFMLVSSV